MTSTPSISRLLMRAWAPVSFIGVLLGSGPVHLVLADMKNPSPGRGAESARARESGRALRNYEEVGGVRHGTDIFARSPQPAGKRMARSRRRARQCWWTGHE